MKKMGRKLITGTAMAACAAVLSACGAGDDSNVCVYGPPPEEPEIVSIIDSGTIDSPLVDPETLGEYDPAIDINVDVYGPPEYWE